MALKHDVSLGPALEIISIPVCYPHTNQRQLHTFFRGEPRLDLLTRALAAARAFLPLAAAACADVSPTHANASFSEVLPVWFGRCHWGQLARTRCTKRKRGGDGEGGEDSNSAEQGRDSLLSSGMECTEVITGSEHQTNAGAF